MHRLLSFGLALLGAGFGLLAGVACSSSASFEAGASADGGVIRRDAAPVDPTEAGPELDAGLGPAPSCEKYCDLVMASCTGENAQYASTDDCLAFCAHLPLEQPPREADEKEAAS